MNASTHYQSHRYCRCWHRRQTGSSDSRGGGAPCQALPPQAWHQLQLTAMLQGRVPSATARKNIQKTKSPGVQQKQQIQKRRRDKDKNRNDKVRCIIDEANE
jgi:hypothetical protein